MLGNVYRPPRDLNENYQTFIDELTPVLYDLQKRQCEVVIAGDYNIDLLKVKQKLIFNQYLDTLISLSFFPKITLPTRFSNKRGTLIDNFLCKFSHGFLQTTAGIIPCGISDHFPYFDSLDISPYTNKNHQYIKVKTRGPDAINNLISEIRNSDMTSKLTLNLRANPNENYNVLATTISKAMEKSMPTKLVKFNKKKHKKSKWITLGILNSITYRDKMYNKLKDTPKNSTAYLNLRVNLRTYNKILNTSINKAKSSYYHRCFENAKNDMKREWSTINEILHKQTKKTKFPDHYVIDGKQITDQKAIQMHLTIILSISDQI